MTIAWTASLVEEVITHLEGCAPDEGCGVIFREADGTFAATPMKNAYEAYRQRFPGEYPRTARTAYVFDGGEFLRATRAAEGRGAALVCIFHSHVDVGAYFSSEDSRQAAPEGQPLFPGVVYLVVAVDGGRASGARLYEFVADAYREVPLPVSFGRISLSAPTVLD